MNGIAGSGGIPLAIAEAALVLVLAGVFSLEPQPIETDAVTPRQNIPRIAKLTV